ncbi:MAG: putative protein YejG [Candidatus Erwinia impunctatus]|nr:putative protein YejG [Culicoides impunctatus]
MPIQGDKVNKLQHSVVHRLPQCYRWCSGLPGSTIEPVTRNHNHDDDLVALKLLSHHGEQAWVVMLIIKDALAQIQLNCVVLEWQGEPCLFVSRHDEFATTCRLKNFGVGIAENFVAYPIQ